MMSAMTIPVMMIESIDMNRNDDSGEWGGWQGEPLAISH